MTRGHSLILDRPIDVSIKKELDLIGFNGLIKDNVIKIIFDAVTWHRIEGAPEKAFIEPGPIKELFKHFNFFQTEFMTVFEATAFIYRLIMLRYNIRSFSLGILEDVEVGVNKRLTREDFKFDVLYAVYSKTAGEVSDNFLLFDSLFIEVEQKDVVKISKLSDVMNVSAISDYASKDILKYKIGTKSLNIKTARVDAGDKKELIVLQDSSGTMEDFEDGILAVKAYITDRAIAEDFDIRWLYITSEIHKEEKYTPTNVGDLGEYKEYFNNDVDLSTILSNKEFTGKNIIIITDGTDDFNFPFSMVTEKIHLVYFLENEILINKFNAYGKCFKAFNESI